MFLSSWFATYLLATTVFSSATQKNRNNFCGILNFAFWFLRQESRETQTRVSWPSSWRCSGKEWSKGSREMWLMNFLLILSWRNLESKRPCTWVMPRRPEDPRALGKLFKITILAYRLSKVRIQDIKKQNQMKVLSNWIWLSHIHFCIEIQINWSRLLN